MSESTRLLVMTVTCELHDASLHLLTSSPFLISQIRTSSFAPTIACPEPDDFGPGFATEITFESEETINPKVSESSYLLYDLTISNHVSLLCGLSNKISRIRSSVLRLEFLGVAI